MCYPAKAAASNQLLCHMQFSRTIILLIKFGSVILMAGQMWSCKSVHQSGPISSIDTLLTDKISIRALAVAKEKLWYGADKARYGYINLKTGRRHEASALADSVTGEFRSIALAGRRVLIASAGAPAVIFSVEEDLSRRRVYLDPHPDAFFDSMRFLSPSHGFVVGDPTSGCFTLLQSFDAGGSWNRIPCSQAIANLDGEAAFAASNGNIASSGNNIWIFTGGKSSRILKSVDKGKTWSAYPTPMISGKAMTGTFAGDFYDPRNGIIVGGDYENPVGRHLNKAVTTDGGITWKTVSDGTGFGYASTVKYVPGSRAKKVVAAGPSGVFMSFDSGRSWNKIIDDSDIHALMMNGSKTIYAAGRGKILRITLR